MSSNHRLFLILSFLPERASPGDLPARRRRGRHRRKLDAAARSGAQSPAAPAAAAVNVLPARGAATAPIVILLFSDFECPYCARVEPVLEEVRKTFQKEVQVVFKHNPLPIHPHAPLAHEAAAEAARQGKFWEMHDALFANQRELELPHLVARAERLGLDVAAFRRALETRVHRPGGRA